VPRAAVWGRRHHAGATALATEALSVPSLSQDRGQWRRKARKEFGIIEGLACITNLGTLAGLVDVGEAGFGVNNPDSPCARREVLLRLEHKIVRVVPGGGNFDGEVRRAFQTLARIIWVDCCRSARGAGAARGGTSRSRIGPAGWKSRSTSPTTRRRARQSSTTEGRMRFRPTKWGALQSERA